MKQLRIDKSGVSPVIGVVLMVAITVILAAVIGSFVLGLGDRTGEVSPNITFNEGYDNDTGDYNVTVTVDSAATSAEASNILVRTDFTFEGGISDSEATWNELASEFGGEPTAADTELATADQITLSELAGDISGVQSGDEIRIVYETDDSSDTLRTFTVP